MAYELLSQSRKLNKREVRGGGGGWVLLRARKGVGVGKNFEKNRRGGMLIRDPRVN